MKTGDLAERLGIHENTVRAYSTEFSRYMSASALKGKRRYTDRDALILATIVHLRNQGVKFPDINAELESGNLIDALPSAPDREVELARKEVALVPLAQLQRALDQIRLLEGQVEQLSFERDRVQSRLSETESTHSNKIAELNRQLGEAQGELRSQRLWLAVSVGAIGIAAFAVAVALMVVLR